MATRTSSEVYDILLTRLRKLGFGWVVGQIQEQVRSGKPIIKAVAPQIGSTSDRFLDESESAQSRNSRRQRLAGTENYTDDERLDIALSAIESVVIQTAAMEESLVKYFFRSIGEAQEVVFEPDEFDEADKLVLAVPSDDRRASTRKLELALKKLREEAGLGN